MLIKVLDREVVAQIAAGEVVERAGSVVKELVENSLDAGASQIRVEVRGGGLNLIRVTDNGAGIPPDEVELAFRRHATSKIKCLDDLQSINSLGFRGEALPSIAAVSEVEIVTCADGQSSGTYLRLDDGKTVERKSEGRARGTTVAVHNLFRKVPARLKFQKSIGAENSYISQIVSQYALAFPEAGFNLTIDGKPSLKTPGRGQLMESVIEVYGVEVARQMLEVKTEDWESGQDTTRVTGLVSPPSVSRSGRGYLSLFVNRRWINSRAIYHAIEEAYHDLLPAGKHPIAVINISVPLAEVDVNIHPAKSEVKFRNESRVYSAVQRAVRKALVQQAPAPAIEEPLATYASPPKRAPHVAWVESDKQSSERPVAQPMIASLPVLRPIGQIMGLYILAEGPDGLYIIDQHAAHERVLYEKIREERSRRDIEVQGLLEPATLEVNPVQEQLLHANSDALREYGFDLEPFGNRTYLVRTVPGMLFKGDWAGALRELLDSLPTDKGDWEGKIAASMACHGAVRAGQVLSEVEIRELIRRLEQADSPHTCPHGRPTMIRLGSERLNGEFKRT